MDVLSGYKTYIVGAMVVLIGVIEGLLGMDIPGANVGNDWMMYILSGVGLNTLRLGIKKGR